MGRLAISRVTRGMRPLLDSHKTSLRAGNVRQITSTQFPELNQFGEKLTSHEEIYRLSIEKPETFWSVLARSRLKWDKDFHTTMDCDFPTAKFGWFLGGKLNVSVNCVDRWADQFPDRTALVWEKDEQGQVEFVSYAQLKQKVCKIANILKQAGVKKGDVVGIYMPVSPLAVASMLACARIGAVHNVIFAGFSVEAIKTRVMDSKAVAVITADEAVRAGKRIPLKKSVDSALVNGTSVKTVLVMKRTGVDISLNPKRDVCLEEAMQSVAGDCDPVSMEAEDPLFLLYTSGSTGKPKGVSHSSAGYLLYSMVTMKHAFDYNQGELFGCVADIGWITGHSYVVYGPLANGGTSLLFESTPVYPNPGRYWEMVERLKVNHFYGAPTALRLLIGHGDEYVTKYDRSSLRKLGAVGEHLNPEAWHWYHHVVGEDRCDIIDTWWQTETGGVAISPRPSAPSAPLAPGKPQRPMFGIKPVLMDDKGRPVEGQSVAGALCLATPWPGIARTLYGDHDRFVQTYFSAYPGYYFTGDGAYRDEEGYYQITGRMDDVINVTGHRLGTSEVEDVLTEHSEVAEAAVVGFPHAVKGEGVYAYIVLKQSHTSEEALKTELRALVKSHISGYAVPDHILFPPSLPKTRSGKIMRRILRKVAANKTDELGDTSTLAEPEVVNTIVSMHETAQQKNSAK